MNLEEEMARFVEAYGRRTFYYGDLDSWVKRTHGLANRGATAEMLALPGVTRMSEMRYWSAYEKQA